MFEIQSMIYIIMYRKEIYKCFQPIYSIVGNKNGSGVLCDTFFKISYFGSILGRHLEYWSYARFAKVANAGFLNYRPRRTFWYIVTNEVLRRPPTRISNRRFQSYLLHYIEDIKNEPHSDQLFGIKWHNMAEPAIND